MKPCGLWRVMAGLAAVLLCGGKGARMLEGGVTTHKPLLEVAGMPATRYVISNLLSSSLNFSQVIVVVPPGRESEYNDAIGMFQEIVNIVVQPLPLGTGNAVYEILDHLLESIEHVYVSFGTQPLVQNETVEGVLKHHVVNHLAFSLATVVMDSPYAPLIRDEEGAVIGSVESHLEGATIPENGETNIGAYWASRSALDEVLKPLHYRMYDADNNRYNTNSGELGFPNEMVRACLSAGLRVDGVPIANEEEMMGIKTPETLEAIREIIG